MCAPTTAQYQNLPAVDAALIAHFCRAQQPPPWTPPAPEVRQLQARVRRLEALVEMRGMEHNRPQAGSNHRRNGIDCGAPRLP